MYWNRLCVFFFQGWKWFGEIEWDLSVEDQTQRPKIVQSPSRLREILPTWRWNFIPKIPKNSYSNYPFSMCEVPFWHIAFLDCSHSSKHLTNPVVFWSFTPFLGGGWFFTFRWYMKLSCEATLHSHPPCSGGLLFLFEPLWSNPDVPMWKALPLERSKMWAVFFLTPCGSRSVVMGIPFLLPMHPLILW